MVTAIATNLYGKAAITRNDPHEFTHKQNHLHHRTHRRPHRGSSTICWCARNLPRRSQFPRPIGRCGTLTMIAKLSADVGMGVLTGVIDSYRVAFGSIDFQNPDGLTVKDRLINKTHAFPHQLIDIPRLNQSEREQRYGQYC